MELIVDLNKLLLAIEGSHDSDLFHSLLLRASCVLDSFRCFGEEVKCSTDWLHYQATCTFVSSFEKPSDTSTLRTLNWLHHYSCNPRCYTVKCRLQTISNSLQDVLRLLLSINFLSLVDEITIICDHKESLGHC